MKHEEIKREFWTLANQMRREYEALEIVLVRSRIRAVCVDLSDAEVSEIAEEL